MSVADDLVEALYPFWSQDYEDLARAIGSMWDHVEIYTTDQVGGAPGWCLLFDPENAPVDALPWLAQVVGERLRTGLDEPQQREWIVDRPNAKRGTPLALARAAQRSLENGRVVELYERTFPDGTTDPMGDNILVYTYSVDTPNPAQVFQDLLEVSFADMAITYEVLSGLTWVGLAAKEDTWEDVTRDHARWVDVETGSAVLSWAQLAAKEGTWENVERTYVTWNAIEGATTASVLSWGQLAAKEGTWDAVKATYTTWDAIGSEVRGGQLWTH